MRYPKRHSTYGRVIVKTIQLFLGKYTALLREHFDFAKCCTVARCAQMENTGDMDAKLFYILWYNRAFSEKGGWFLGFSWQESRSFMPVKPDFP